MPRALEDDQHLVSATFQKMVLGLIFAAVALGQLIRLQIFLGTTSALNSIDLVIVFVTIVFGFLSWRRRGLADLTRSVKKVWFWRAIFLFLLWALISLGLNASHLSGREGFVAFSYWLRLFLLISSIYLLWLSQVIGSKDKIVKLFIYTSMFVVFLGYLQLILVPNFSFMSKFGWDPHVGRMLSTFFDPNFLGAFLVLSLSIVANQLVQEKGSNRIVLWLFFFLAWLALYLTFSRSAWVTGAIALSLAVWPRSWKTGLLVLAIFIIVALIPNRLSSRFLLSGSLLNNQAINSKGLNNSSVGVEGLVGSQDLSAAARLVSIKKGLTLAKQHWLIGVGYNNYGSALLKAGLTTDQFASSHAGNGSDSSLVNIFATTGVIGLSLFLIFFLGSLKWLYRLWRQGKDNLLGASMFGFSLAWLAGSFLDNTLPYVFILLPWLLLMAVLIPKTDG